MLMILPLVRLGQWSMVMDDAKCCDVNFHKKIRYYLVMDEVTEGGRAFQVGGQVSAK